MLLSFNNANNNRIDGASYDAAGNMTCTIPVQTGCNAQGGHTLTYDAEGHVTAVDAAGATASYVYDAEGRRVRINLPGQSSWYNVECLYDLEGHCITKNNDSNQEWSSGEVFGAGQHIASYNSGTTFFSYTDWLGTERYRTLPNGVFAEECSSLPFGDNLSCSDDPAISLLHFTGKERDSESGNDYFGARYYASTMGRWLSPDPKMISKQRMTDPQQWNMYSYARNTPLIAYDPDGKEVRFKDEATAQHAISDYRAQLPKSQGGAVNYKARDGGGFMLTVDPKAAADAGSKSRLGELSTVATSKKVAEVNYVGKDDPITYNKGTNTDAPTQATSSLGQQQLGGVTLFEQGTTPQSPANDLGYNSATPGATEIYVDPLSSHNLMDPGDPLMHETLEHFYPFTQTGDANQSGHPNSPEMPPKEEKPQ